MTLSGSSYPISIIGGTSIQLGMCEETRERTVQRPTTIPAIITVVAFTTGKREYIAKRALAIFI